MNKFCIKHPFIILGIVFVICVLFAKGESVLMTPADLGIVMGALALFLALVSELKPAAAVACGVFAGLISSLSRLLIDNNDPVITFGGALFIIAAAAYCGIRRKDDHDIAVILMLTAGFWLQFCYAQYTPCWLRQNDVGFFYKEVFDPHHAGYISYIRYYGWIPHADVREMDQWYHPPFHHIICAYFLKIYGAVFPKYEENYDILQMLTLMYSFVSVIFMRRIIKMFDISDKTDKMITLLLAAFPIFIINAGELNNDILSVMLFVMAIYYIFKWYREGYKFAYLIGSAVSVGLGMMTKLSVWMAAVPVGTILLVSLVRSRGRDIKLWGQYAVFALISFPLGLWFPIRNYIGWGVPPTYIPVPIYDETLEKYSVWLRLFDVFKNTDNYNIPYYALWSALFDDDDYRRHMFWGMMSFIVSVIFAAIVIVAFIGIVYMITRSVKDRKIEWEKAALVLLLIVETVSYTVFCFEYPYYCTMNFRYIIPVTLTFALGLTSLYEGGNKYVKLGVDVCTVLFAATAAVFYLSLWWYDIWLDALSV